jgi:uncharacterized protein YndB with AHSA1/START domain
MTNPSDDSKEPAAVHATLIFRREIPASIETVFAAFADVGVRASWSAPSESAVLLYDRSDFREGGEDAFRCGARANPNIFGSTRYLQVIPHRRIVSSETIAVDGKQLCASLTTLELSQDGPTTMLTSTIQVVSFVGRQMIEGHESGNASALDNLVAHLKKT